MSDLWVAPDWSPKHNGVVLVPVAGTDAEVVAGLSRHARRATLTMPRNGRRHRLYWATLSNVIRNTRLGDRYARAEHLHKALLLGTGHCAEMHTLDGEVLRVPDSTSYSKMGEDEFGEYFEKAMALLAQELGCDPIDLKGEVHV